MQKDLYNIYRLHHVDRHFLLRGGNCHNFVVASLDNKVLGPVVQSIVSLTSSLRGQLVKFFATL